MVSIDSKPKLPVILNALISRIPCGVHQVAFAGYRIVEQFSQLLVLAHSKIAHITGWKPEFRCLLPKDSWQQL
ncbi:hypothetical protein CPB83DRAFT_847409, partial [Crepidotus variabilis]